MSNTIDDTNDRKSSSNKNKKSTASPLHQRRLQHGEYSNAEFTEDSIYEFYTQQIFPAILASTPILFYRILSDAKESLLASAWYLWDFVLPAWVKEQHATENLSATLGDLWERALLAQQSAAAHNSSIAEFLTHSFDTNRDGLISPGELLNMTEIINRFQQQLARSNSAPMTFWTWFSREWPLMDWKIGLFLWRTFGGILVVLFFLSIIPGRLHSLSGNILRWPILFLTYSLIGAELIVYTVIRLAIRIAESLVAKPKHRALRRKMAQSRSYEEWYQHAAALDISQKRDKWQRTVNSNSRYNWALIRQLMQDMRQARAKQDILLAEAVLQQCTRKNVGGIMSEDLFSYTNTGEPKFIVKEFIDEVDKTLHWITDESIRLTRDSNSEGTKDRQTYERTLQQKVRKEKDRLWKSVLSWAMLNFTDDHHNNAASLLPPGAQDDAPRKRLPSEHTISSDGSHISESVPQSLPHFHREELIAYLKRARSAYGRTALCLSGGAMMGLYHFGHLLGLMETDSLPFIISGTSAGSVIGAVLCTRTNEELRRDLSPEVIGLRMKCFARPWPDRIRSVFKNGHMFSGEDWLEMIEWFTCGKMTFQEAYLKTGRTFCITLASTTKKAPPVLLNHTTAPHITLASAVVASAAVPFFIKPVRLQIKDANGTVRSAGDETYFDGSIEHDIPINGLAEQLNCQFFVAAQCNPHVVPFFFNPKGGVGNPSRWSSGEHEASWRGGFLLAALEMYLLNDMKSKFRFLHEAEAAVGFTSAMMAQEFVGSITIVPQVQFTDYFRLFSDPTISSLERYFQVGSVAAYQHAAMIRLHYRIADTIDECLEKLNAAEGRPNLKVKPSRRASFEVNQKISAALADIHAAAASRRSSMPAIITAALNERLAESDSTSMSDDDVLSMDDP
jgi:predicted acylesterase/phospholipase RssA